MFSLGFSWVGSPADVATFIAVIVLLLFRMRPDLDMVAAAVVALGERDPHVDADRLQHELGVDDNAVEAIRPTIVSESE